MTSSFKGYISSHHDMILKKLSAHKLTSIETQIPLQIIGGHAIVMQMKVSHVCLIVQD